MLSLQQACRIEQRLPLKSGFFKSVLPRTESLLKRLEYQKPLRLLKDLYEDGDDYQGVIDWLLALLAPAWKSHVLGFYRNENGPMVTYVPAKTIEKVDRVMVWALVQFSALYKMQRKEGWETGSDRLEAATTKGIKPIIGPRFPAPPSR